MDNSFMNYLLIGLWQEAWNMTGSVRPQFGARLANFVMNLDLLNSYWSKIQQRFGIGSDGCKLKISPQKRPYDSPSYLSLAGPSPILIIDWS